MGLSRAWEGLLLGPALSRGCWPCPLYAASPGFARESMQPRGTMHMCISSSGQCMIGTRPSTPHMPHRHFEGSEVAMGEAGRSSCGKLLHLRAICKEGQQCEQSRPSSKHMLHAMRTQISPNPRQGLGNPCNASVKKA